MEAVGNTTQREPWNKGKIIGQKAPFKPKDIWALRVRFQIEGLFGNLRSSTWVSTASCAGAIWSRSRSGTFVMATR